MSASTGRKRRASARRPPVAKLRIDLLLVQRGLCESRAKAHARIEVHAALDRTAMELRFVHPVQYFAINLAPAPCIENTGNATHG